MNTKRSRFILAKDKKLEHLSLLSTLCNSSWYRMRSNTKRGAASIRPIAMSDTFDGSMSPAKIFAFSLPCTGYGPGERAGVPFKRPTSPSLAAL
jgi:hypothetical protein